MSKTILLSIICGVLVVIVAVLALTGQKGSEEKGQSKEESLMLTISLDKKVYSLDESISIHGIIENMSQTDLIINTQFVIPGDISFKVQSDEGEVLKGLPPAPPLPLKREDFKTIKPGRQIPFTFTIHSTDFFGEMAKGKYKIQVMYTNSSGDEFGLKAWKGTIYSNEVSFEVQ